MVPLNAAGPGRMDTDVIRTGTDDGLVHVTRKPVERSWFSVIAMSLRIAASTPPGGVSRSKDR